MAVLRHGCRATVAVAVAVKVFSVELGLETDTACLGGGDLRDTHISPQMCALVFYCTPQHTPRSTLTVDHIVTRSLASPVGLLMESVGAPTGWAFVVVLVATLCASPTCAANNTYLSCDRNYTLLTVVSLE